MLRLSRMVKRRSCDPEASDRTDRGEDDASALHKMLMWCVGIVHAVVAGQPTGEDAVELASLCLGMDAGNPVVMHKAVRDV